MYVGAVTEEEQRDAGMVELFWCRQGAGAGAGHRSFSRVGPSGAPPVALGVSPV